MSKAKIKATPKTETFEADIINSSTVKWIENLCIYIDRLDNAVCPDSIRKTIEKTQTEFVKWVEKTMNANKIPTDKGIRIMSLDRDNRGQWSKHAARPEIKYSNDDNRYIYYGNYDMVIAWFASGMIIVWQSSFTSLAKFLGTPYEISESDFTPEPTPEPTPTIEETEPVAETVKTPAPSKEDQIIKDTCVDLTEDLSNMHSIGSSTFRGSYNGECTLPMYNQWEMFLLNKFIKDKFIHDDDKLSLRKLTTLKKKVIQLNADVKNLDEHFARYNDFANLVISQCFNSAEYTMQFANGLADIIISSVNNVLENGDTNRDQHAYAYKLAMEHKDSKEILDIILFETYYGIHCDAGWSVRDILHRKECVSAIVNRIIRNWDLYNPKGDMAFDSPCLRDNDDYNFKKHLCMMYPEMFGYKTATNDYAYVVTPVEKFKKDYDNALAHFRSLFFILTWAVDSSAYAEEEEVYTVNRPNHVIIDDKMWSIKVPDTEFLSAINNAPQNNCTTDKLMEHLVDTAQVPEAYCYFDDTNLDAVSMIDSTNTLTYIGNYMFRTLQEIVVQAVLAKTTDTHGDFSIEYVQGLLNDFAAKLFGKAITPVNEQYDRQYTIVKNTLIASTKKMLERIENLEKGLLASECPEFIEWCIKDQFISKDLGEARLKELEEKAKEKAAIEQKDVS